MLGRSRYYTLTNGCIVLVKIQWTRYSPLGWRRHRRQGSKREIKPTREGTFNSSTWVKHCALPYGAIFYSRGTRFCKHVFLSFSFSFLGRTYYNNQDPSELNNPLKYLRDDSITTNIRLENSINMYFVAETYPTYNCNPIHACTVPRSQSLRPSRRRLQSDDRGSTAKAGPRRQGSLAPVLSIHGSV